MQGRQFGFRSGGDSNHTTHHNARLLTEGGGGPVPDCRCGHAVRMSSHLSHDLDLTVSVEYVGIFWSQLVCTFLKCGDKIQIRNSGGDMYPPSPPRNLRLWPCVSDCMVELLNGFVELVGCSGGCESIWPLAYV